MLARTARPPPPLAARLPPQDDGVAGARLAIKTTTHGALPQAGVRAGRRRSAAASDTDRGGRKRIDGGGFVVADMTPAAVLGLADALKGRDALILNAGSGDDRLREADCRPTCCTRHRRGRCWRTGWRSIWCGSSGGAGSWCAAPGPTMRRSPTPCGAPAKRFGGQDRGGAHVPGRDRQPARRWRPRADPAADPRPSPRMRRPMTCCWSPTRRACSAITSPIAHGMRGRWRARRGWSPTSWHPALEQWGATQFQNRFRRLANRPMRPLDYDVWVAVRSIGEAATRTQVGGAQDADRLHEARPSSTSPPSRGASSATAPGTASCASRSWSQRRSCR